MCIYQLTLLNVCVCVCVCVCELGQVVRTKRRTRRRQKVRAVVIWSQQGHPEDIVWERLTVVQLCERGLERLTVEQPCERLTVVQPCERLTMVRPCEGVGQARKDICITRTAATNKTSPHSQNTPKTTRQCHLLFRFLFNGEAILSFHSS